MKKQGAKEVVLGWLHAERMSAIEARTNRRVRTRLELRRIDDRQCRLSSSDLDRVLERIADDEQGAELDAFLKCSHGPIDFIAIGTMIRAVDPLLAGKAIVHFMHQVKRKMADVQVDDHMMVILRGQQRAGKTRFVERLLDPLPRGTVTSAQLSELNCTKGLFGLADRYVIFTDELEHASRTSIGSLKNFVTRAEVGFRPMGSNDRNDSRQKATLIGCTNRPVAEQIRDHTGMRRFFEIECDGAFDHEAVNSSDFAGLWSSVDHREPSPLASEMERVRAVQEKLLGDNTVNVFLDAFGVRPMPASGGMAFTSAALYDGYHHTCQQHQVREPLSHKAFVQELVRRGWTRGREGWVRYLVAPAEFVGRAA